MSYYVVPASHLDGITAMQPLIKEDVLTGRGDAVVITGAIPIRCGTSDCSAWRILSISFYVRAVQLAQSIGTAITSFCAIFSL